MVLEFVEICRELGTLVQEIPKKWDGKACILEMKENDAKNWKQMEWMGWYFEYWCQNNLKQKMEMPHKKKYGNVSFDGFMGIPWDFKVHAIESGNEVIVNDSEAIANAIDEFDEVGLVLIKCSVTYDNESREFKKWHDELKGGISQYEINRIRRGATSRKRKTMIDVLEILFVKIDDKMLVNCGSFQENFRNSGGTPRRKKVKLNLRKIDKDIEYRIKKE